MADEMTAVRLHGLALHVLKRLAPSADQPLVIVGGGSNRLKSLMVPGVCDAVQSEEV